MNRVVTTERLPIKLWLDDIEDGALEQAKNLANLPFVFKHIAIMPDAHQGYGMPIGGVMATKGVVVPNAVGVDIGCGMCAVRTELTRIDDLEEIVESIKQIIPVGFHKHKEPQYEGLMPPAEEMDCFQDEYEIVYQEYDNALLSLGTLGGGNHFIEIQKEARGFIWIMVHSGSRNLGKKIADHYNALAVKFNEQWYSQVLKKRGLAFLPLDTEVAQDYIREMNYAVAFALANRQLMMDRVLEVLPVHDGVAPINIAHNYARMENHYGQNVMIHRKGATLAREGVLGIVPGSQGTKSYIVEGKGNKESFTSCSHGAGRVMGRKQAQRELNLEDEIKRLDDQGIIRGINSVDDLDEASGAYKPITDVMVNQRDLVKIMATLTPLAVIKG